MPIKDSTGMQGMTDPETVAHLRMWTNGGGSHGVWAWPTDPCGYDQHIRFVKHRNENWHGGNVSDFNQFVRDYADALEAKCNTKIVSRWVDDIEAEQPSG